MLPRRILANLPRAVREIYEAVDSHGRADRDLIESCKDDPVKFNDEVLARWYRDSLGATRPAIYWTRQVEICEAIVRYKTIVVPTGNSVGKSFAAAGIMLWWLYTRPGCLIVTTAPSQALLGSVLWKEVRRAKVRSKVFLKGDVTESPRASPQTLSVDVTGWEATGLATRGIERLSGRHDPNLMVIVDEASGVEEEIFEALDSLNPTKMVLFGNPIRAEGRFKDLYDRSLKEACDPGIPDAEKVHAIRIPSTESPDIDLQRSDRGLADRGFLVESERQYGRASLWWTTHVEALFPSTSHDSLIPVDWIDRCVNIARIGNAYGGYNRMAVDLSEGVGRDRSVILIRDDLGIIEIYADSTTSVKEVSELMDDYRRKHLIPESHMSYDGAGMLGKDLGKYLQEKRLFGVNPYMGSGSGGVRFKNLRTACGYKLRNRLDPDRKAERPIDPKTGAVNLNFPEVTQPAFHIPMDPWWPSLRQELIALKYHLDQNKTAMENKEDMMKSLGRSPDLADSLMQSFWRS